MQTVPSYDGLQPDDVAHLPAATITTLSNGLRVATEPNPSIGHTATIGVYIKSGSRFETPEQNGAAHFLEHLAFKGTKRRSRLHLEKEVENIGGHLNAYTSREQTAYFASVMKPDIPQAVDILSDIILHSEVSPADVENERSTILEELNQVYKDKEEYVFDYLHDVAYSKTPLGQTILGPVENIKSLMRQDLVGYIKSHYLPERMVLAGTGAVEHSQLVQLAKEKFGHLKRTPIEKQPVQPPKKYIGGDYRERQDGLSMAHVAIAYETCGWKDPDTFPLIVMNAMIGNWNSKMVNGEHSSNRLVATMAAYRYGDKIMPFNTIYEDTGMFGIYGSFYESRLLDASNCLMKAFSELVHFSRDDQVEEVKNTLVTNTLSGMESSTQMCEELGRQILTYGRKMSTSEMIARINAVDGKAIKDVAQKFFNDQDHSMAALGPILELPPYEWFRKRSYNLFT